MKKTITLLGIIFLITSFNRLLLAIIILPIIYFVYKGNKKAMILAGIYSGILTIVNIAVYIENNRNEQGDFYSSLMPAYIYLGLYILALVFLKKSYKTEKLKTV